MSDNARKMSRVRSALGGLCLAVALTGMVACAAEDPAVSAQPGSAGQSPTAGKPSASPAASSLHMVDNGGHRLAFHLTPGRLPAIVLDAGGGEDSSYWNKLAPVLAAKTGSMIITYDRAGLGQSDEVRGAWNVEAAVSDLKAGLTQLGITGDVILVPHSQAGEVATYFAKENPELVAGAVLVDASLPDFYTNAEIAKIEAANQAQVAALKNQPSTKQTRQLQATAASYGPMHRAYHKISWPQNVPATAIVSATTPFDTPDDAQLWRDAQQQFVHAAANRQLVTAERSSHDIARDRQDVIVDAVEKMLTTAS